LIPNDLTNEKTLVFKNSNGIQFTYDLRVLSAINAAPVITSTPKVDVTSGKIYTYQVMAEDLNGDELTYGLLSSPEGMTISSTTGLISWQAGAIGRYQVLVSVKDGRGGVSEQAYSLLVATTLPNRPPVFTTDPVVDAKINTAYRYDADAVDPDQDQLIYSLLNGPEGMKVNPNTGEVTWTPPATTIWGDTVISSISNPGERDSFNFSGAVGQRLYFDPLKYTGAVGDWRIQLYSPTGNLVIDTNFSYEAPFTLTQAGNYKLVVETNGDKTGSYAFSLIDVEKTPRIGFDQLVSGGIVPGSEADIFTFTGDQGQELFFDKLSNYNQLSWALFDTSNRAIWSSTWEDVEFKLPYTGEYLLAVRGQNGLGTVGNYELNIVTPDVITTGLELNQVISGQIVEKGEKRVYTFDGSAGQQLFYDALGGDYFSYTLLDPSGKAMFSADSRSDRSSNEGFVLTTDGTYRLVVDGVGEGTGNYRFRLLDKASATQISLDTDIVGQLSEANASDVYKFTLESDRYIYFDSQAGSYPNHWLLYAGDGRGLIDSWIYDDRELTLAKGEYLLVMQGTGASDRNYKIRLVTPEFQTSAINFNEVVSASISEPGERDTFTFSGVAGQRLFYDGLSGAGFTSTLLDPSGRVVPSPYGSDTDSRVNIGPDYYTLKTTGTYKIVIDGVNNTTGDYKFRLLDGDTLPSLALDTEVSGTIDQGGLGTIGYKFSATAGQHLYLDTGAGDGGNFWSLHSVNGQQIGFGYIQDGSVDDQEFDVGVTGEYLLFIRGNGAANTNYRVRLTDSQPVRNTLAIGDRVDGSIAKPGQSHTYTFSGTVGQQLHLDVLSRGNPGTNVARIYDQRGTEVYRRGVRPLFDLIAE
jgi:hypothetical protein